MQIKAFNLIKTASGVSQSAVLEYASPAATELAMQGLNKLEISDFRLAVQRVPAASAALLLQPSSGAVVNASVSTITAPAVVVHPSAGPAADPMSLLPPTRIVRLSNMTTPEDLADDEGYLELKEDVVEVSYSFMYTMFAVVSHLGEKWEELK